LLEHSISPAWHIDAGYRREESIPSLPVGEEFYCLLPSGEGLGTMLLN
jgi:hypothetical protein